MMEKKVIFKINTMILIRKDVDVWSKIIAKQMFQLFQVVFF